MVDLISSMYLRDYISDEHGLRALRYTHGSVAPLHNRNLSKTGRCDSNSQGAATFTAPSLASPPSRGASRLPAWRQGLDRHR